MPEAEKVLGGLTSPVDVVNKDRIGLHPYRPAVDKDHRCAHIDLGPTERVVTVGRHNDEPVNPPLAQLLDQFLLSLGILLCVTGEEKSIVGPGDLFDKLRVMTE